MLVVLAAALASLASLTDSGLQGVLAAAAGGVLTAALIRAALTCTAPKPPAGGFGPVAVLQGKG